MKDIKSKKQFRKARSLIPGGVDSPVRAFRSVGREPIFVDSASGAKIKDIDENFYTDYILSWGPLILGHAHPIVLKGIPEMLYSGTTFGLPTVRETRLAEIITNNFPSIEKIRFVNSGTEAVMSAIRLARAFTGRNKLIKFEGCYHGHTDSVLVQAGSGLMTQSIPSSSGIPEGTVEDTILLPYNNLDALQRAFNENSDIAAVILEPVPGNMGVIEPEKGFLEGLIDLAHHHGALVIFDEVISGYRVGLNGVQGNEGIYADITTLGKIIGGGMPVGAFGARAEIMDCLAPEGKVYQAGTLSGNPVAMQMGINQLEYLNIHPEVYEFLEERARQLEEGINSIKAKLNFPVSISRYSGMFTIFFREFTPKNYKEALEADTKRYSAFFNGLLERGILIPPSQFETIFLSTAHSEEDINKFIQDAGDVLEEME